MQLAQYVRMSTVLQSDSPETQKSIIREYCEKNGHAIVKTYEDDAVSGGSMDKRGALIEMIMDAEKRLFEGIVIYKYDRAFRNLEEQVFVFKRLKKHNIKIIAVADPGSEGASGELIINILGAVNQFERQLTGERIYDKRRKMAKEGRWTGSGSDPFGYHYDKQTKKLVVIPEEADTVRLIFDLYLKEKAINKVVDILYALGKKTKTGKDWSTRSVHQLLIHPLYIGKLRWGYLKPGRTGRNNQCEIFDGKHEAIITEEVFCRAAELLAQNKRFSSNYSKSNSLLSGLLKCSICGGSAVSNYLLERKKIVYYCKDKYAFHKGYCRGWHRMAYKLEGVVYEALNSNIKKTVVGLKGQNTQPAKNINIEKRIATINSKLARQIEMYEEGIIDKETFKARRLKALMEKEQLEKQLKKEENAINPDLPNAIESFEDTWKDIGIRAKRELLRTFIQNIYTDGFQIKIEFADLGMPGWELETEVPVK
jgi:site-specific DNA recombinase